MIFTSDSGESEVLGKVKFVGVYKDQKARAMPSKGNSHLEFPLTNSKLKIQLDKMRSELIAKNLNEGYIGIQWGSEAWRTFGPSKSYAKYGKIGMKASGHRSKNGAGLSANGYSGDDFDVLGGAYQNAVYRITLVT